MNLTPQDINELLVLLNTALSDARLHEISAEAVRRDSHNWPFTQEERNTQRAYVDTLSKWIHIFSQQVSAPDFTKE